MKIAFWSPEAGHSGTTGSMLAIALLSCLKLKKSVFLLHNQFMDRSMEKAVFGNETADMYEDIGLDSLARNIKVSPLTEDIINNSSMSLYKDMIHILPGTAKENKNLFEKDISITIPSIINAVNSFYDLTFVNLAAGADINSSKIMEEADLIVVTFAQDKNMIDKYFSKYHLPEEKTLYLIGKYNCKSRYNLKNLERCYPKLKNKTEAIPYNVGFMDAMADGKVMQFIVKNLVNCKGDNNKIFFKKINKAVDLLFGNEKGAGEIQ
ncbi:hypothetical protein Ana3638_20565 [Anaerocolumna sedimenticola]|uniref:AAA domain-containing protein n=1 Tax=Anaerocolumna sedimenticola TaxID=2696063 RepID=A0A6P1TRA9_9FIRM|nr:hypothetical protein [Anaerocolumna sedimenticola]QHQ62877.1 hypothetical protein Ana3638_20565 [Anaerocolumna sedimenticola]